jgi:16S rRNA (cytidine1402-2'-O)-methyltransferase
MTTTKTVPETLSPGLYIVATPIGNLGDITLRAIETLKKSDAILCEDTRVTQKLLLAYSIKKPLYPYHDHNAHKVYPTLIKELQEGKALALLSDAGMPLVADPGYQLVQACIEAAIPVTVIPGPSAVLTALALSGLPPDRFAFLGFFDVKKLDDVQDFPGTLIFFEAPHRIMATLEKLQVLFPQRACVVARELTKYFEEVIRGTTSEVFALLSQRSAIKGEIVLLLGPPPVQALMDDAAILAVLEPLLERLSLKEAVASVADALGISKKRVYQLALNSKKD